MSENLFKVMKLEEELDVFFENGVDATDSECEKVVLNVSKLLEKLNNDDLLYLLLNAESIHKVIDVTAYFKKYKINKKKIKNENTYKENFKKLRLFVERIREVSICEEEYMYICTKCDVDCVSDYLLTNMSNEDIMDLSQETDDWNYKLFLFGNLKA